MTRFIDEDWEILALEQGFGLDVGLMLSTLHEKMTPVQLEDHLQVQYHAIEAKMRKLGIWKRQAPATYFGPRFRYNKGS